ncbi:MAG: hypothetical protein ACREPT_05395 [Rudaea sp.]
MQTHDKRTTTQPQDRRVNLVSHVRESNAGRGPLTKADFVGCVDYCVRLLVAESRTATATFESAQARLRGWLHGKTQALDDGTPIDFVLFDAAILSIEERLPQSGAQGQARLLHASRLLAESVYAKT